MNLVERYLKAQENKPRTRKLLRQDFVIDRTWILYVERPVKEISYVYRDGLMLGPNDYGYDSNTGAIYLSVLPPAGTLIEVVYYD